MSLSKVIYIAGPYRGNGMRATAQNIRRAGDLAYSVWEAGFVALCPHTNAAHFDGQLSDEVFLLGDLELLRRCDAVLLTADWRKSKGAVAEVEFALGIGIPVYESLDALIDGGIGLLGVTV